MSSTKKTKIEPAEVIGRDEKEAITRPVFTTKEPSKVEPGSVASVQKKAKDPNAPRGSNLTPKSPMRIGRDWGESSWRQAFKALCKKWDRENFSKKSELK